MSKFSMVMLQGSVVLKIAGAAQWVVMYSHRLK